METVNQPALITCSNCGAQDTGAYCSMCGAALHATPRHPFWIFLDTFLKLSDLKDYLLQYARLLRSPVRHTIRAFEEGHLHGALRFAEWSLALFSVLTVSRAVVLKTHDWIAVIILTLTTVLAWSVTLWVYYLILRRKSPQDRSFRAYLTMACLYIGFTLPPAALGQWAQSIWPVPGTLLLFGLLGCLIAYAVPVWKYFWALPGKPVIGYYALAGLVGMVASTGITLLTFSLFPGSRFGVFEFDHPFAVNLSQLFDPFLHVHIDARAPYTHPEGLFRIEAPEGWTVTEQDTLHEYAVHWHDPTGNGFIGVNIIEASVGGADAGLDETTRRFVRGTFIHPLLVTDDPVRLEGGGVMLPFSYSIFTSSWKGLATVVMQGRTYAERHGAAVVLFSTLIPEKQEMKLEPQLADIRSSLEVLAVPETWTAAAAHAQLRANSPLHPVEITGFVRYRHPQGLFALDVPENWSITAAHDLPGEATVQWHDPYQNGFLAFKVLRPASNMPEASMIAQARTYLVNTLARDPSFVIDEPVRESADRLRLDFSSTVFIPLSSTSIAMRGTAYVERRGPFVTIFCTYLPAYEVELLTPQLTHIHTSIEVYRDVLWQPF